MSSKKIIFIIVKLMLNRFLYKFLIIKLWCRNETKVNTIQNNYGFIDTAERGDEKEELVDELLCPHGQIWKLNGEVLEDIVKDYQSTRFKWPNDELQTEKTIQDFFSLMFPMHLIPQILKHTNEEMESYNESPPL